MCHQILGTYLDSRRKTTTRGDVSEIPILLSAFLFLLRLLFSVKSRLLFRMGKALASVFERGHCIWTIGSGRKL